MDRQKKIIIGIVIVLLVIAVVAIGWRWWAARTSVPSNGSNENGVPSNSLPSSGGSSSTTIISSPQAVSSSNAIRLARLFTPRFATFTSQSNFEDIVSLASLTTSSFSQWMTTTYIPGLRQKYPASSYVGQTTSVLGVEVKEKTDTSTTLIVRTQQQFVVGDNAPIESSPVLTLKEVKQGNSWFVDSAQWNSAPQQ